MLGSNLGALRLLPPTHVAHLSLSSLQNQVLLCSALPIREHIIIREHRIAQKGSTRR